MMSFVIGVESEVKLVQIERGRYYGDGGKERAASFALDSTSRSRKVNDTDVISRMFYYEFSE